MKLSKPIPLDTRTALLTPMVAARVKAGFPSPADDHLERSINLNEELIHNRVATFMVRVEGESMRDAGIHPGDVLIIDKSITPADRDVVVAMIDGEFTVKRFRKLTNRIFLDAENPDFKAIEVTEDQDFKIWGVVTYAIHNMRRR